MGRLRSWYPAWVTAMVALAGCGLWSSTDVTQSCTVKNIGTVVGADACTDYVSWPFSVVALCSTPSSVYSPEACPSAKRIGGCFGALGPGVHQTTWYYPRPEASPPPTSVEVMNECKSHTPAATYVAP